MGFDLHSVIQIQDAKSYSKNIPLVDYLELYDLLRHRDNIKDLTLIYDLLDLKS